MPDPADVLTPRGVRLGDMSNELLANLIAWCEDHPSEKSHELREYAEAVYDKRLNDAWLKYHSPF